ncbi:MAG: hypothetical protein KDC52_02845 [Ignavibacteriae bacterium]|nr:hypothetical protein [Ignavibacteriota bacterium]
MNIFFKRIIVLYLLVFAVITILYFTNSISQLFVISSIYAGALNLINALAAVKLFQLSHKAGNSSFIIYNLGGLTVRLISLLIAFVIVIKFLNIDEYAFIFIFFIFYFVSLIFEVFFYIKTVKKQ